MITSRQLEIIKQAIRQHGKADQCELFQGIVNEVNETTLKMKIDIGDGLLIPNVRIRSVSTDDKGFWVIPSISSTVIVGMIEGGTDFILVNCSEIDKVFMKIGSKTFQITAAGIVMNGGSNNGIPKSASVASKLNILENDINSLKIAIGLIMTAAAAPGGSATVVTLGALSAFFTGYSIVALTPTTYLMIQNPDVTH